MAGIRIKQGHSVTGSLPSNSDAVQVRGLNMKFTDAPVTAAKKKDSQFPPIRAK